MEQMPARNHDRIPGHCLSAAAWFAARSLAACLLLLSAGFNSPSAGAEPKIPQTAAGSSPATRRVGDDWPEFLGPRGTGISGETGLLSTWGDDGPSRVFRKRVGNGYTAPSILGNTLVVFHRQGDQNLVEALQANKERILLGSNTKTFNGISLPIGALIGTVKLVSCTPTETAKPSDLEEMFGNYDSGRFAWVGVEHKVITPIPFIGRQGFFDHEKQQYPLFS